MEAYNRGAFEEVDPALAKLLGRKPTAVKDYLHSVYLPQSVDATPAEAAQPRYLKEFN